MAKLFTQATAEKRAPVKKQESLQEESRKRFDTERRRQPEEDVTMEAQIGEMQPEAKECCQPLGAGRGDGRIPSWNPPGEWGPANTWTSAQ